MKLIVKDVDLASGGTPTAIMNEKDAEKLDLMVLDRIKIRKNKKKETAVLVIAESKKAVPLGHIGLFEEVLDSLSAKHGDIVNAEFAKKPLSLQFIKKKLDGHDLTKKEIEQIVWDIVHNKLSDVELTYFVSACYTNRLNLKENIILTKALVESGDRLRLKKHPVVDKHCIGGVAGNRTTMVLVPIIAAAGYTMPKTSSRSITSASGTADTMEVFAKVSFPIKKMRRITEKTNGCIVWGGSLNLAPGDDKIIRVERPLGIDAESQLLSSILAKKCSVSSTHVLIDIPTGKSSKLKRRADAFKLKEKFETIGKKLKMKIRVIITEGSEPIGNGIGPALEARDVLWVLGNNPKRPMDLERKCLKMAAEIFDMIGVKDGRKKAYDILKSGFAYKKFMEIIKAQGGNPKIKPEDIKLGKFKYSFRANKNGKIKVIENPLISRVARVAGAPDNKGSGLYLYKHVGDNVKKGDKLFTIYSNNKKKIMYAIDMFNKGPGYVY